MNKTKKKKKLADINLACFKSGSTSSPPSVENFPFALGSALLQHQACAYGRICTRFIRDAVAAAHGHRGFAVCPSSPRTLFFSPLIMRRDLRLCSQLTNSTGVPGGQADPQCVWPLARSPDRQTNSPLALAGGKRQLKFRRSSVPTEPLARCRPLVKSARAVWVPDAR